MMLKAKLAAGALVLAALTPGAAIWAAPLANATTGAEQGYLNQLEGVGIHNTNGDYGSLQAGYAICQMLRAGAAESAVIDYVDRMSGLDAYDSGYNVGTAEVWLCPDQLPSTGGWVA
jgi:hypothetical protein